jgi:hypothetical protein
LFDAFGDAKTAVTRVWIKGNVAVSEIAWTGTLTSEFMGMKPSKKPSGGMRVHVASFNDDGLIKEEHEYGDGAGFQAQLQGKPNAPAVPVLPSGDPQVHVAKGTPDEDKLVDVTKTAIDAFNKDAKAVIAAHSDESEVWVNIFPGPAVKGKKEVTKTVEGWFKTFPDQKWAASNSWGIDGFAISEQTMTGTQKGKLVNWPPSNKLVADWHWLVISQPNADGKIDHAWAYANLLEAGLQTGAFKPPKPPAAKAGAAEKPAKGEKPGAKPATAPTEKPATKPATAPTEKPTEQK